MDWGQFKLQLGEVCGITDDALHVHVGLLILLLSAWASGRPPWSRWPVATVASIELINEIYDLHRTLRLPTDSGLPDSIHDYILTMVWPIALWIVVPMFNRREQRAKSLSN